MLEKIIGISWTEHQINESIMTELHIEQGHVVHESARQLALTV